MLRHVEAILAAVHRPDVRSDDPRAHRERFYRRDLSPGRWLRVVVDFSQEPAFVITAMVQHNDPQVEKR
jgi:hypothetical protein